MDFGDLEQTNHIHIFYKIKHIEILPGLEQTFGRVLTLKMSQPCYAYTASLQREKFNIPVIPRIHSGSITASTCTAPLRRYIAGSLVVIKTCFKSL